MLLFLSEALSLRSKLCLSDTKVYFKLRKQILMKERSLADFSISELLIYLQTSQNLPKMLSLLFVSFVVPLGLPLVIVTMILYPQIVLTRHFWTSQQINQVQLNELNKNKIILKQLLEINKNFVNQLPIEFSQLSKLNNLPKIEELSFLQLYLLKRLYKVSPLSFGSNALIQHIYILQLLDQKMLGDQNKTLSGDELRLHLYLRKLNYDKMDIESMRILLNKWLQNCSELPLSTYAFSPCLLQK
ncbi:hypothetical protein Mgra_00001360 [Meloidogyne graminicola]|uniref:Letm1 RBD domain-containing protein n=1 Tax=Meloidogyne graminicola TaxID=189291 RepID=A0A8T0A1D1_9BILA|nr:hypothetical protein Mgra_00001360 [Meloidogyne graminicola]